jgi:hypothetical protein
MSFPNRHLLLTYVKFFLEVTFPARIVAQAVSVVAEQVQLSEQAQQVERVSHATVAAASIFCRNQVHGYVLV